MARSQPASRDIHRIQATITTAHMVMVERPR